MKFLKISIVASVLLLSVASCKKEETPEPTTPIPTGYTIPTTYNFTNANYLGQTQRIAMMDALSTYMKTGNTSGTTVDAIVMKNMFSNTGNPFADNTLNASGKQLKSKTYALDQALFESYFDSLALNSQSTVAGTNGVAGVVVSPNDATKKYLCSATGIEYNQLITKGLMGATFYYQATSVYLENISTADNATIVSGQGTAMEHNWDEVFGYFGVPTDFPTTLTGLKYWGSYSNQRNGVLASNATLMTALLKGRAAISNQDYTTRDAMVTEIRNAWEKIAVGSAIHYINAAKDNLTDDALRNHALSECLGFVMSLKYNISKTISDTQLDQVKAYLGNNFYTVSINNLDNAKNLLSTIYNLDAVKDNL
jgi:hypothetical protein